MHELIKQAMGDNEVTLNNIENYAFELQGPEGKIVIPQVWESLARPGWTITVKFKHDYRLQFVNPLGGEAVGLKGEGSEDEKDLGGDEAKSKPPCQPVYEREVRHTVEFWHQQWINEKPQFLFEKQVLGSFNFHDPSKTAENLPVLQEVIRVTRTQPDNYEYMPPPQSQKSEVTSKHIVLDRGDEVSNRTLIIRSPFLLNALRAVVKYSSESPSSHGSGHQNGYPPVSKNGDNPGDNFKDGSFPFPYRDLFSHKNDLLEYKASHPARERHTDAENTLCDSHIDILVEYLESQNEIRLKDEEARWMKNQPTATFGCLWILIRPGSDVYVREYGQLNAYVVESLHGGPNVNGRTMPYEVNVWNLEFDGMVITRSMKTVTVPIFDGEREIMSLPLFPIRFHRDDPEKQPLREQLVARGKKYVELAKGPAFREYTGNARDSGSQTVCESRCRT